MALRNTISNESGFPGLNENAGNADSWIKAVYEYGAAFSVDVNFYDESVDELGATVITPINIQSFTFTPYDKNLKCAKKANDTVTISGSIGETFTDAYYNFLMPDKTVKTLPMNTNETFLALVKWSPPRTKHIEVQHVLSMTYKLDSTMTTNPALVQTPITAQKNFQQGIYWNYSIAVAQFQNLVSKGSI